MTAVAVVGPPAALGSRRSPTLSPTSPGARAARRSAGLEQMVEFDEDQAAAILKQWVQRGGAA